MSPQKKNELFGGADFAGKYRELHVALLHSTLSSGVAQKIS